MGVLADERPDPRRLAISRRSDTSDGWRVHKPERYPIDGQFGRRRRPGTRCHGKTENERSDDGDAPHTSQTVRRAVRFPTARCLLPKGGGLLHPFVHRHFRRISIFAKSRRKHEGGWCRCTGRCVKPAGRSAASRVGRSAGRTVRPVVPAGHPSAGRTREPGAAGSVRTGSAPDRCPLPRAR